MGEQTCGVRRMRDEGRGVILHLGNWVGSGEDDGE